MQTKVIEIIEVYKILYVTLMRDPKNKEFLLKTYANILTQISNIKIVLKELLDETKQKDS